MQSALLMLMNIIVVKLRLHNYSRKGGVIILRLLLFSVFLMLTGAIGLAIVISFAIGSLLGIILAVIFGLMFIFGLIGGIFMVLRCRR